MICVTPLFEQSDIWKACWHYFHVGIDYLSISDILQSFNGRLPPHDENYIAASHVTSRAHLFIMPPHTLLISGLRLPLTLDDASSRPDGVSL